jgi:hypothetical protein
MKDAVLGDVTSYDSCKNRCSRGRYHIHNQYEKNG